MRKQRLSISITEEEMRMLKALAVEDERSLSAVTGKAIRTLHGQRSPCGRKLKYSIRGSDHRRHVVKG
jgi:hypothetical protein